MARPNEQGSALLLTIVVTVIVLFLGGAFGLIGLVETKRVQTEEAAMQAYYLARSGADAMAQAIIDDPALLDEGLIDKTSESIKLGPGEFRVKVSQDGAAVRVQSMGMVRDQKRVVELTLKSVSVIPAFQHAVVGLGKGGGTNPAINITGNVTVSGDVATNASDAGSVRIAGNVKIKGDLFVGSDAEHPEEVVQNTGNGKFTVVKLASEAKYPPIVFPDLPTGLPDDTKIIDNCIYADSHYDFLDASDLEIDLGGGTRIIRVRHLHLGGSLKLKNVGENGRLLLFVEETIAGLSGNPHINWSGDGKNKPRALTLYYYGDSALEVSGNLKMTGNLVVKQAKVRISGNIDLNGNLFSGGSEVEICGNVSQGLVYVPHGKLTMTGNSKVGAVIANTFRSPGNSDIGLPKDTDLLETLPDGIFGSGLGEGAEGTGLKRGTWSAQR